MKNRKYLIGAVCLVAAAIVLGVGYALTASQLQINGTANILPSDNFDVEFSAATCKGTVATAGSVGCNSASLDPSTASKSLTASMEVTLKDTGDSQGATFTVKNFSENLSADFSEATVSVTKGTDGEYYNVDTATATTAVQAFGTVAAGQVAGTFDIDVELLKENLTDPAETLTDTFTVTITGVEAVNPES